MDFRVLQKAIHLATGFDVNRSISDALISDTSDSINSVEQTFNIRAKVSHFDVTPSVTINISDNGIFVETNLPKRYAENGEFIKDYLFFERFSRHRFTAEHFISAVDAFAKEHNLYEVIHD